jgi:hypothetical protein
MAMDGPIGLMGGGYGMLLCDIGGRLASYHNEANRAHEIGAYNHIMIDS